MRVIIIALLASGLAMASIPAPIFGPAGYPTEWDIDKLEADSVWADWFSTSGATSGLFMHGDSLVFTLIGASADRDMVLKFVEEDGTAHSFWWDDGGNRWRTDGIIETTVLFVTGNVVIDGSQDRIYGGANLKIEANAVGAGTLQLGEAGDGDIEYHNSYQRGAFVSVSANYTLGVAECVFLECTTNSTVSLPASPTTGDYFRIKFTNASGGTLSGNGKNIDGSASVAAAENDAFLVLYNGSEWSVY